MSRILAFRGRVKEISALMCKELAAMKIAPYVQALPGAFGGGEKLNPGRLCVTTRN